MCGINLLLDRNNTLSSEGGIRRMTEATLHRGPDAQAWVRIEQAGQQLFIGNNRLKILDLSQQGNQPMQCAEKGREGQRYTLSYNGEIYNHFELKNELLQKGYQFRSNSDTEVLLYALVEWGEGATGRLNGMFAFIFYDQQEGMLLLARDRWGMKPLYYFQHPDYLIASSEIRGIIASTLVKKKLNESQLYHYLQFRYAQKPQTFFQDINELLPGQQLKCYTGKPAVEKKSFLLPNIPTVPNLEPNHLIQEVEEKLTDALFSHLHSHRPTGIFLSGGMDSTLMLALLRNNSSYYLPDCFTIVNSETEAAWGTQDYLWANRAAKQYDFHHHPVSIDASVLDHFSSFIHEQDQPIGDGAAFLTSYLAAYAGSQVKVVLSGAGADELFGGYNRHLAFYKYLQHYQKIRLFLPVLKTFKGVLPSGKIPGFRKSFRLWNKLLQALDTSPSQTFLNFLSFQILEEQAKEPLQQQPGGFAEGWLQAALLHDQSNYLISDILALNDKACMQHGLEMRMPFLSEEVAGLATSLPGDLLLKKGRKWLLAEILKKHGGEAYARRNKEGFGMPFGLWIKNGKTELLWEWLNEPGHLLFQYLSENRVRDLLKIHKSGKEDLSQELFSLTVLAHWLSKEFR